MSQKENTMRSMVNELINAFADDYILGEFIRPTSEEYLIEEGSIKIDLKGAKKEDVEVTTKGNKIHVKSKKSNVRGQTLAYSRAFIVDTTTYDISTVNAKYEDSILTINVDKKSDGGFTKVTIN